MRILFITSTRIGDAVLSSGLLHHLIESDANPDIWVACGMPAAPLFAETPGVTRVIPLRKRGFLHHWRLLWWQAAQRRWDLVVDLRGSAIAWLLWTKKRRVLRGSDGRHRVERLASFFGIAPPPALRIAISETTRARAAMLIPSGAPVLALGPTANSRLKQWPVDRFIELTRRLISSDGPFAGARVAVFGAAKERAMAQPLLDAVPQTRLVDLVGHTDVLSAYACLTRCAFYIGNDSGLMHLAAAAGIPTLGLFGPSPERLYAPWGKHTATIRGARSYEELWGEFRAFGGKPGNLMGDLAVDDVERAVLALLEKSR
jgi:ADP-heptose:LPS heptosyltransferase